MARYALVIGIARYDGFSNLPKAATDAEAIAQLLERHHYNVTRLPKKLVAEKWVVDGTAKLTGTNLCQELKTFLRDRAIRQDALIYFAGHGFRVTNSITDEQEGYLATFDCARDGRNGIPFDDLNTLIRKADLGSLVILLDCCYGGALLEEQRSLLQSTQSTISQKQNYCLIAACRDFERAREGEQHGIFTAAVIKGLSADYAVNEEITSNDLFGFVSRELTTSGQEVIHSGMGRAIPLVSYASLGKAVPEIDESVIPYQGLKPFEKEQAQFFFGREQAVEDVWNAINQSNFVAVIGASGSGKSSVVRAGLIPWLEKSGWRVLGPVRPGTYPLGKLVTLFEPLFEGVRKQKQLDAFIHSDPEGLRQLAEHLPEFQRFLLVVDQFEEVFTLSHPEDRHRFIDLLTQVAKLPHSRLAVVTTMRADFVEPCLQYSALTQLIQTQVVWVTSLTGADLEQAIMEPAKRQGYTLESGLLGEILQDVRQEPGCLPLLQFALRELWERRDRKNRQLTRSAYREIGGAIGALNRHADELYQGLSQEEQRWVKFVCLQLTRTGGEEKDTRQRQPKQDLLKLATDSQSQQVLNTVLTLLVDERLSVTGEDSGEAWVDLAHEALMEGWQEFAKWRKEDRELRRLRDRVEDELRDWLKNNQTDDFLMSRGLLVQVTKRWSELKAYLQTTAQEFYQRSYDREREKISYEADINQFKVHLQALQMQITERLQAIERLSQEKEVRNADNFPSKSSAELMELIERNSLEEIDESKLISLREEVEDSLERTQRFEQRIHLANLAADWLGRNQKTLVELMVQYSLASNPQLTNEGELAGSSEKVQKFSEDISRYMDWLRDSLILGEPIDERLEISLTLTEKIYAEALGFIKQEQLPDRLPGEAIKELQLYLDYLINYLLSLD